MFQFKTEDAAIEGAKLLAVREAEPILVMARAAADVFNIGRRNNAALREAGRHVATVYWSGHVDFCTSVRFIEFLALKRQETQNGREGLWQRNWFGRFSS